MFKNLPGVVAATLFLWIKLFQSVEKCIRIWIYMTEWNISWSSRQPNVDFPSRNLRNFQNMLHVQTSKYISQKVFLYLFDA
jgi:hypothetical protein